MRSIVSGLLGIVATAGVASPALADWRYTHWGDSPAAVIAQSGGKAVPVKGKDGDRVFDMDLRAKARSTIEDQTVDTLFFFDRASRLTLVKLERSGAAGCDAFGAAVSKNLGTADTDKSEEVIPGLIGVTRTWHDQPGNLAISFHDIRFKSGAMAPLCHVLYRPLGTTGPDDKHG